MARMIVKGELRAYIKWDNKWRNAYIVSSYDQMNLLGAPVRMLEFRLTKSSKVTYTSEKINFHKNKPAPQRKGGVAA